MTHKTNSSKKYNCDNSAREVGGDQTVPLTWVKGGKDPHCKTFSITFAAKAVFDFGQSQYAFDVCRGCDKGPVKCDFESRQRYF